MKDQHKSTKLKIFAVIILLSLIKNASSFLSNTLEIRSYNISPNSRELTKDFITPTSLSLSMDSIAASFRPFGSWYCQEDNPIGRLYYE